MASVKWSGSALQDLEKLDKVIGKRIVEKVGWLEQNFFDIVPERLHRDLRDLYKLRVGDYRAVYSVNQGLIIIEKVGHRRDIYK
ncbi:hypothetical protein A2118_03910 [Candidatus Kaiserbacteria bacterium GWA2_50_9]|uniref:Addiction module toxin RelE n=1 Tax=Candidatus Kaiserbacteria bacterium GWA2_50_9 TaxID=1798474 RepID=A0A1F6BUT8_9BACT|nr:MAG: hypothetical protein A2118_03910 [Candidatus Kaiserbacteria bacterium GWA2_50_9]